MIIEKKTFEDSTTNGSPPTFMSGPSRMQAQKLSVELPVPKQIYTVGSRVAGIVRLGPKDRESIQEVKVSLVCVVRSIFHRYYGGNSHDFRQETTKLFHRDQTLWSRAASLTDSSSPPSDIPFEIIIPNSGIDIRGEDSNAPLPPSFHAGRHTGWSNMFTHGTHIGYVRYHVKAAISRHGLLKLKERAITPFIFLPSSPPPPLLPPIPQHVSEVYTDELHESSWARDMTSSTLRQAIFASQGQANLTLWLPASCLPRLSNIPFFLLLTTRTSPVKEPASNSGPGKLLPPPPRLDKATLFLGRKLRVCARKGVQTHTATFDKTPSQNFLHGITPSESEWRVVSESDGRSYWEKAYMWRGLWSFKETPNFRNRQLTVEYFLVAEVPFKGLRNDMRLTSHELDITTGIIPGEPAALGINDMLELPPDYFENDGGDEEDDQPAGKSDKI